MPIALVSLMFTSHAWKQHCITLSVHAWHARSHAFAFAFAFALDALPDGAVGKGELVLAGRFADQKGEVELRSAILI